MRLLPLLLCVAACDPIWYVQNVATAKQPLPSGDCVDAGIRASGLKFSDQSANPKGPERTWFVGSRMEVKWMKDKPRAVSLVAMGIANDPPPGAVAEYRSTRDTLIPALQHSCGPLDISPEECGRVQDCAKAP